MLFCPGAARFIIMCAAIHISHAAIEPKILLPFFGNYQVNYTINTEEGCYRWKSLREEIATISPIESTYNKDKECSKSALVVVTSAQPIRKTTLVLATNVITGTVFQSDVIVDRIHIIDIVSRTRELYLADPPEELKIRALDQEGNTFSSTAGMEFEWSLAQDESSRKGKDRESHHPPVSAHSILHVQKFLDTIYVADPYVDTLERKGKTSDTILISGIQTGAAVVMANLVSTMECHKEVNPSSVRFVVRDKVILNPSHDIYLLRYAVIRYRVERWREGVPTEIKMPSLQYVLNVRELKSESGSVISLDEKTSTVVGLSLGHSQVYLVDQHLKHYDDSLMEQATSDVHVAEPAYLRFEIEPYHKWILEVGKTYEITVQIYSEDNRRIWPADNVRLHGTLNPEYLKVLDSVENGTWYLVQALTKGSCDITSLLKGVVNTGVQVVQAGLFGKGGENLVEFEDPIFTSQNLEIFDEITVAPPVVVFPWQPESVQYKYTFKATGGSGNYTWSVNETEASSISYTGEVSIGCGVEEKLLPRRIEVMAIDIRNSHHYGDAIAVLAPPAKLQFALSRLEAEVTTTINLYIGMYAKFGTEFVSFTDCSEMRNLRWSIHDTSIFEFASKEEHVPEESNDPMPLSPSCLLRQVRALKEGHTTVSLSYHHKLSNETLQASTVIAAYSPLRVKDPMHLAVVSLGSAKTMIFEGGPNPWPLLPNNHEKVIKGNNDNAEFKQKLSGKEHTFIANCLRMGEVAVTFTVHNKPCPTNPFPQTVQISIGLSCATPASLKITTEYLPPSCPLYQNQNLQIVVLAGDTVQVTLSAYDRFGNQFDNFTSLSHEWTYNVESRVTLVTTKSEFLPDLAMQTKQFIINDLLLPVDLGATNLQVQIDKYEEFLDKSLCSPYGCKVAPSLMTSMLLDVVSPVTLLPQSVGMFNRPNYSVTVEITGGSGHFEHTTKTESSIKGDIVTAVSQDPTSRSIKLNPLTAGHATLIVNDLCIPKATQVEGAQAHSSIIVSDLSSLVLNVPNPLEIGTSGKASIQLDMKHLSAPDGFNINIQLSSEPSDIVSIDPAVKGEDLVFYSNIIAQKIGTTTLKATTSSRVGKIIMSNSAKVTVFPPLMLKPPRITVIRGSEFHLYVEGGPPEDAHIYYDLDDSSIASSSSNGILSAHRIGNTTVRVRAVTKDGQVFLGRSSCQVHVVQIKGVLIDIPTHRFYTGSTMPVHVYGYAGPGYDPVDLDSNAAGLVFKWSVNNHAVLSLRSVHSDSGVQISDTLKFTMLLSGKSPGQGSISVSVSATNLALKQLAEPVLETEMQVTVFDPLTIQSSQDKSWSSKNNLLLTPETTYYVLSNRDSIATKIAYVPLCETCTVNISTHGDNDACIVVNEELKSITTGQNPCQSTVLVTAHERFNVAQTLVLHVRVKMVSFLIAEVEEKFYHSEPDTSLSGFPLGSKLSIQIHQFDNFGLRFDAAKPKPSFRANRDDLVEMTPSPAFDTLRANAAKTGITIFTFWSEKNVAYNFPLPVVTTITGEETDIAVPVGLKKCFQSDLVESDGKLGKWSINKPRSFALDSDRGALLAMSRSPGELVYSLGTVRSKVSISAEAFMARFDEDFVPKVITNAKARFVIPIIISGGSHDTCPGLEEEMSKFALDTFDCAGFLVNVVEPVKIFQVSAAFISDVQSYACVLDIMDWSPNVMKKIATFEDASFTLDLTIKSEVGDRGISLQSPVNVRFLPAFKLVNESQVIVTEQRVTLCVAATLEIHNSIEITTDSRNIEIHAAGKYEDGIICHELSCGIDDDFTSKHEVKISSTLTGQQEVVKLTMKWSQGFCAPMASSDGKICADTALPGQPWIVYQYSFSYLGLIIALTVIIITTVLLFSTCGFLKWAFASPPTQQQAVIHTPGPRMSPPGMVPYSPSNSYLFPRSSPVQRGTPSSHSGSPSPRKPQLWSTFYQPQNSSYTS